MSIDVTTPPGARFPPRSPAERKIIRAEYERYWAKQSDLIRAMDGPKKMNFVDPDAAAAMENERQRAAAAARRGKKRARKAKRHE
jgi:hypothetical protein